MYIHLIVWNRRSSKLFGCQNRESQRKIKKRPYSWRKNFFSVQRNWREQDIKKKVSKKGTTREHSAVKTSFELSIHWASRLRMLPSDFGLDGAVQFLIGKFYLIAENPVLDSERLSSVSSHHGRFSILNASVRFQRNFPLISEGSAWSLSETNHSPREIKRVAFTPWIFSRFL